MRTGRTRKARVGNVCVLALLAGLALCGGPTPGAEAARISGSVRQAQPSNDPIANCRVTLFSPDLTFFRETRSQSDGSYQLDDVPPGTFRLGFAPRSYEYRERSVVVGPANLVEDASLGPELEPGRWDSIGTTEPEFLDATDIGFLLPDGRIFYCHDTTDPILFDPSDGSKELPSGSPTEQGCMNGSLLPDGSILMAGGQDGADPGSFRDAIPWVKRFEPSLDSWELLPDMLAPAGRWYPGMARLADGSFLVIGGGTAPDAARTNTCERFDLDTFLWSFTGSMQNPTEFPPVALLHTGDVLATWWPPQLYDVSTGNWRATGNFVQSNRWWPGHSDHSIVVLEDGRVLAVGIGGYGATGAMGEIYDPVGETWSVTSSPQLNRFQSEVVQLPDGRVLVAGGESDVSPPPVANVFGLVKWTDLYDPAIDSWRRVADMPTFREYHGVSLLLPDGRVAVTGGTRIKFQYGPTSAAVEAYSPPYLFRGVRPQIAGAAATELGRGQIVELTVTPATALTELVLLGVESHTHWVTAGIPRRLSLPVAQVEENVTAVLPADPNVLPLGHYLLFAMVDDIPSDAIVIRVIETDPAGAGVPGRENLHLRTWPNPMGESTRIALSLPRAERVSVAIFDAAQGRRVRNLWSGLLLSGPHYLEWDGRDDRGRSLAAGTYLYRVITPGGVHSGKVAIVR